MATAEREFDLVVYGAASFVGRILCRYLVDRHGVDDGVNWALAGRNQVKLDAVNDDLATSLPTIIADAVDKSAVQAMADRTKVVCSPVGP